MNALGRLPANAVPTALVALAHVVVLWWLIVAVTRPPVAVLPPKLVASLMSEPVVEPAPLPIEVERRPPKPVPPRPVSQPRPVEAPPVAAPSERAITAPPPSPPAAPEPVVVAAAPAPEPAAPPPPPPKPEPVVLPRADASYLGNAPPAYPSLSKRLREVGRVLLSVHVLADGSVGEISLRRSSGFERLDRTALETVRGWRFVPAKRGGEPIAWRYDLPVDFQLTGDGS